MLPLTQQNPNYEKLAGLEWGFSHTIEEEVVIGVCPECDAVKWVFKSLIIDPLILIAQRRKDGLRNA